MLQITGARHVLRRDPAAAEEALRTAEDVGRRSMQELRGTVALLRSDEASASVSRFRRPGRSRNSSTERGPAGSRWSCGRGATPA